MTQLGRVAVNSRIRNSYSPLGVIFKHGVYVMEVVLMGGYDVSVMFPMTCDKAN